MTPRSVRLPLTSAAALLAAACASATPGSPDCTSELTPSARSLNEVLDSARAQLERSYVFVGDETGPVLRRVDRLAMCTPRILGRDRLARRISAEARDLDIDQPVVVRLRVLVEVSGFSREVRIAETSGDFRVDQAAARVFDGVDFAPARVEGITVPVWASFPVTFTPR